MSSAHFFHKTAPIVTGGICIITVKAYPVDENGDAIFEGESQVVILDDILNEESHNVDAAEGSTPQERALPGTKAFVAYVAGLRGISITAGDVVEVPAP